MNQHPEWLKFMREQYTPGTEGTLDHINDGRTLALIPGEDSFKKAPEQTQDINGPEISM